MTYPIIENAKRQARMCFYGIAIPMLVEIPDDRVVEGEDGSFVFDVSSQKRYLVTEKVLKFNRKALRRAGTVKAVKADPRMIGSNDTMIIKVGEPGSRERVEALRSQYEDIAASGEEVSPFAWRDE
jgi:uncharacterized protein YbaA (DUF1428 family)